MSFIFIINDSNSTLQQCELVFEEQPGFTLLTQSAHKKQIRAGIKNTQYLLQADKEQLQAALDAGVPLWFRQCEIKQYCRIYLPKMTEYPINCKRFAGKTPQHARFFHHSFHAYDLLEDNILIQLFKMSQENYALIETAIGYNKTLRYTVSDYQHGQKLPKNAMLLLDYPEEIKRKIGKDYQSYKHLELIKQIPEAAIKLLWALGSAIERHPVAAVVTILSICLLGTAAASVIADNSVKNKEAPQLPDVNPVAVKPTNYPPTAAIQQANTEEFVVETMGRLPDYDNLDEKMAFARRLAAIRSNLMKSEPFSLFMNYLLNDQDAHAEIMLHKEKTIDLHHGAPGDMPILSYVTTLTNIKADDKLKVIIKLIKMGSVIHLDNREMHPLFIAARLDDLQLVKFYLQQGSNIIVHNGNLLSEVLMADANNVYIWLFENSLVDINKKIEFADSVSLENRAKQVPILTAILKNKFPVIRQWIAREQLKRSTLNFYFDDLFLASFAFPHNYHVLSLTNLLYTGSENTLKKLDNFVKKHSHKVDTKRVQLFIDNYRQKDTLIKKYFQQNDVRNMLIELTTLLKEGRFDYVKHLMLHANIHINDKIGKHPLLTHIVLNQVIPSDQKIRICMKLVEWNAEINREDLSNPLMHAVQQDDFPLVTFFQLQGGKLITKNHHALYWAILSDARQVMDNFLKYKFNINQIIPIPGAANTPILAIANSKNRHILKMLRKKYGLDLDTLSYYLEYIVNDALDFKDAESWLLDLFKVFEPPPEWTTRLAEVKTNLEKDPAFNPAHLAKFNKFINNYVKSVESTPAKNSIPVEASTDGISFWKQYPVTAIFLTDVAAGIITIMAFLGLKPYLAANNLLQGNDAEKVLEKTPETDLEIATETVESFVLHLKKIEPVSRHIVDTSKTFFPLEESAWKESLQIKLTLTEEEKRLYKQITITHKTRTWVVEKLCGFLKEAPKNPEEQGRMLRRDIIMCSPEYLQVTANDRLIKDMIPYLQLVQLHQNQKAGFDRAFSEIRIKNNFPPILSRQQTILDKLKQHEQRINVHEMFLKLFNADLGALIQTIQKNMLEKYDDAHTLIIYQGLNAVVKEREAIREWCNNQGVAVEKIKIKSSPLEPVKKPVLHTKSRNAAIPQIPRESADNKPALVQNVVPPIPKPLILSRKIDYMVKQDMASGEQKKVPFIQDARIFYILHLMDLMRDTLRETHPVLQKDAARQLLSKCFDTIHTFCHHHAEDIQDIFTWWKSTWHLRNQILHNTVLWEQQDSRVLLQEFIDTFEKPFGAFKHQRFCSKPIETNKLKNLCLFMPSSQRNEMEKMTVPNIAETIQRLTSSCEIMHDYYVMAEKAVQKKIFECDGKLHAAMASRVTELRDIYRELLTLKNHQMYSGPQFAGQRKQCIQLIRLINTKIMNYNAKNVSIIDLANCIAHETTDFKEYEVSKEFYNGYQFRFKDQLYYVQEPVPYLTLYELFKELHQGNYLSQMLKTMGQEPLPVIKRSVPVDLTLSFARD